MFDKMKQLMEMKKQAEEVKRQLDSTNVEVNSIKGIKIIINGAQRFQSIEIDDQLLNSNDKVKLQNDLLNSMNAAIKESQEMATRKMRDIMPGIPGI